MVLSEEDVAALRADLGKAQREKEAMQADLERIQTEKEAKKRENEAKLDRLRRERSMGTSFDGLGSGNSSDRRGTAASTMGPMWTRGVSATGGLRKSLLNFPRGIVPKFSVECSPSEYIAWERRFEVFIADLGLRHTISPDAPEIAVINCTNNAYLFGQLGEDLVTNHRRVWGYISEATAGATFEASVRVSLHFGCLKDNEGVVVDPSSSRAAFACGGARESSVHGGRRPQFFLCPHFLSRDNDACCWHRERCIRNCSVHSPPVPGTSIEPPCFCRRSWFSGREGRGSRSPTKG